MKDQQYLNVQYKLNEIEHKYGPHVHILNEPYLSKILATFCVAETKQPRINFLVKILYSQLLSFIISAEFPRKLEKVSTRMIHYNKQAQFEAELLDVSVPVVSCAIARAGVLPSQVCYETLNTFFDSDKVRQDFIYLAREVNENQEVIGACVSGHKIGGPIEGAYILIPDPMGATGGTVKKAIELYKECISGTAKKVISLHLIMTPEYIKNVTREHPDVHVYALRLDRGLSSQRALNTIPGTYIEEEKGLNEKDYIIPGAGGIGEILNNSFV
ncbi:MAG: uracil phosphoribosyltransferase [Deltaproteobacteria bacterium]|nr:uracil phosphoribosyltransferase [Deltaproteobacteria bacterium]